MQWSLIYINSFLAILNHQNYQNKYFYNNQSNFYLNRDE